MHVTHTLSVPILCCTHVTCSSWLHHWVWLYCPVPCGGGPRNWQHLVKCFSTVIAYVQIWPLKLSVSCHLVRELLLQTNHFNPGHKYFNRWPIKWLTLDCIQAICCTYPSNMLYPGIANVCISTVLVTDVMPEAHDVSVVCAEMCTSIVLIWSLIISKQGLVP